MTIVPLKTLAYNTTNISDDTTPTWSAESGYFAETTRQLNNKLYKNFTTIHPLADYYYDDTDPLVSHRTYRIVDNVIVDATAVICTLDNTVVYCKDCDKYYIFDNTSGCIDNGDGTYTVNFTIQDPTGPVNFTEVTNYRNEVNNPETSSDIWFDLGYTNKYKQLDQSLGSQTIVDGDMEMSFILSKVDTVQLFNINCETVEIIVTQVSTSTELFNETYSTKSKNSGGRFWGYFFNSFDFVTKIGTEIPINFDVRIDINLRGTETKCGLVAIGKSENLGATLYGAGIGMIDFSKKETNDFGETFLVKRAFKSTNTLTVDVETGRVDSVVALLNKYRATPVVFVGTSELISTSIYGIYNNYDVLVNLPTISKLNIDVESLI